MIFLLLLICMPLLAMETPKKDIDFSCPQTIEDRKKESAAALEWGLKIAQFYQLPDDVNYRDITEDVLKSTTTKPSIIKAIHEQNRRFIVFWYFSDGYRVKALITFIPNAAHVPLLMLLRGGNRLFGLIHPATALTCVKDYTVIAPLYRGGVSEGADEFGGDDVNDVKNLVEYIPQLEKDLALSFTNNTKYLLGASRGGMEMFLALQRYPALQDWFDKAACLSGMVDLRKNIAVRDDMKNMFINDFGLSNENYHEWIAKRNPVEHCQDIKPNFPLLIIQGTADNRVHPDEGRAMVARLKELGKTVEYWEFEGETHCLGNDPEIMNKIVDWLESN